MLRCACRAPALFAALLRRAGVAPALLPLLAEPARAAVQGLGILARRRHPGHTAAFLTSLREICAGTSCDAQLVCTPAILGPVELIVHQGSMYRKNVGLQPCRSTAMPLWSANFAAMVWLVR